MRDSFGTKLDSQKLQTILDIKKDYQEGRITLGEAREQARTRVKSMQPYEFALAEQELTSIAPDECRTEDIGSVLDVFQDVLDHSRPQLPEGHPITAYYLENDTLREIMHEIEDLVQYPVVKNQWLELYDRLLRYKVHYTRKQNQLYSALERHGFDRPTTTMWLFDDFVRDELNSAKEMLDTLSADDQVRQNEFIELQKTILADLEDLMTKEETILYPTSLALISEREFEEMKHGDREIGFAWITVEEPLAPDTMEDTDHSGLTADLLQLLQKHGLSTSPDTPLAVATGKLTLEQINLIYRHMPVDFTYVDENDTVKFYTDTTHRVFPRSKNVIGRKVENCHPATSVHVVREIVEKFRSGEEDSVDFWLDLPDKFIYIRYMAVHDREGNYRGIVEMMQDCTHIRSLKGSRTLLTWEGKEDKK